MITLIYLLGVLFMVSCAIQLHNEEEVYLSDLIQFIVFSALSWASLVYCIHEGLQTWMIRDGHDFKLWSNRKD